MRYAYAARGELGDPDFFSYMEGFEERMLKGKTVEKMRGRILDGRTREVGEYGGFVDGGIEDEEGKLYVQPDNHGTSHVVAADASGMTITLTSTVNLLFGSKLVVPETGESADFES
jgi:gamma-glutamyltranspeptidase / glutathione hydrolase